MSKTTRDVIVDVLNDLTKSEFKCFGAKLCDRAQTGQQPRIRKASVENKDAIDIADLLIKSFTTAGAICVAGEVLRAIGCNEQAKELEDFMKLNECSATSGGAAGGACPSKYMVGDKHFVEYHRIALTQRVNMVEPILDELLAQGVIKDEVYSDVKAEKTSQKKMRELYAGALKACGLKGKDIFYEILLKQEEFLINDLKDNCA